MSNLFFPAEILEIRDETPEAYTLVLKNPDPERFAYRAGQYLTIRVLPEGEDTRRAFSLSSAPGVDEHLAVTIKRVPEGKVSNYLRDTLRVGDLLEVMPPMGHFSIETHPDQCRHCIMIGAGSGITPLMSMLKAVLFHEPLSKVTLWYGNRNQAAVIFADELQSLQKTYEGRLRVVHFLSRPDVSWKGLKGRLDKDRIYDLISDLFMHDEYRKQYYLCGPAGLMSDAEDALDKHAVFPSDVFREYYTAPVPSDEEVEAVHGEVEPVEPEATEPAHQVQVHINGMAHEVSVGPDASILDAAILAKVDPPYACQAGICTSCRAKVMRGKVVMDFDEGLSDQEKEEGYILTCQAHPRSPDVVIDFDE